MSWRSAAGGVLAIALTAAGPVRAESQASRGFIELSVAGSAEERAAIGRSLAELLSRLNLELATQGKGDGEAAPLANARVELDEVECRITLTSGADARVLMFRRIARKGSTQVMAETISLIIHGAVEELLQPSRHPMVSNVPLSEPSAISAPLTPAPSPYSLDVSGFAGARAFGGGAPLVAAAGLTVSAGLRLAGLHPEAWLQGAYNTPFDSTGQVVEIHSQVLSLRAGLALRFLEHDSWYLQAGLGGGADVFFTDPRGALADRFDDDHATASPIATALVAGHYVLGSRIDLFAALTVDVDLRPRRFIELLPDSRDTIYEAARVRPALVIGFDIAALGERSEP